MYNVLIINDNTTFINFLINNIIAKFDNLRIVGVSYNAEFAINTINSQQVDIIITNYKLFCNITKLISKDNKEYYNNSFIIISEKNINQLNMQNSIVVLKDENIEKNLIHTIKHIIEYKSYDSKRDKIIYELQAIGYNLNHKGSQYLIEVILEIYINKNRFQGNLKKEIYPIISKRFNASTHNIHCDITRATENMVYFCNNEILDKYFKGIRPTTKTVINIVIRRIA